MHFLTMGPFHLLPPKVNPKASLTRMAAGSLGPSITEGSENSISPRKLLLRADIRCVGEPFCEATREEFHHNLYSTAKGNG